MLLLFGILMAMKKKKLEEDFKMQVSLISVVTKMFVLCKLSEYFIILMLHLYFPGDLSSMHVP